MLERLNEEIKRRTHVVRIFPNAESCRRLVRALCVETHENWLEAHRYLNMDYLRESKKEALRKAARATPVDNADALRRNPIRNHDHSAELDARNSGKYKANMPMITYRCLK